MARIENTLAKGAQLACGGSPSQVRSARYAVEEFTRPKMIVIEPSSRARG